MELFIPAIFQYEYGRYLLSQADGPAYLTFRLYKEAEMIIRQLEAALQSIKNNYRYPNDFNKSKSLHFPS